MGFTKTFISIDWDYCVPIHILNDWGHNENFMFLNIVWNMRKCLSFKNGEQQILSLNELESKHTDIPRIHSDSITIAESHASAYYHFENLISENDDILLIHYDLHHDIWKPESSQIIAENWLYQLIKSTKANFHVIHIIPKWAEEYGYGDHGEAYNEENCVALLKQDAPNLKSWETTQLPFAIDKERANSVFICRSGCWTPPTLDNEFNKVAIEFCSLSNIKTAQIYGTPLKPRAYTGLP